MSGFHLTFSTRGRVPVAAGEGARRTVVRAILRVAGGRVVLFCVVDDHVHVVVLCPPGEVRTLARDLLFALRALAPVEPAHVRPVASRGHAEWLLEYVLTQTDHHALDAHPASWSGSCLAELAGARVVPGWTWNLAEFLPRVRLRVAFAAVGLSEAIEPSADGAVRALGAWRVASAVAFAAAADPAMVGNAPHVVAARRTSVHLARAVGIADRDMAEALAVTSRMVPRLAERAKVPALEKAARVRLALEEAVRVASMRQRAG